ncbi:MAG: type I pullulanase [Actinobacteria bacterium]|uniref:pullulanase n=1 Tax=freshwater metagenome TaxID=449393 RepID=A0A6J7DUL4_9ZZZZ|nr:type I pullulanase [Actinomycetota bacterium]MSX25222.1 type I pullulanase [Actinomycetota bacterium]MSY46446.1 type I pullulanase [Actinomycetota bacterium]MSY57647.1 type I pullulanase [Actinomycetota bacterium]MTB00804.1 type I pullulanase [Actinomycetota bacterium]
MTRAMQPITIATKVAILGIVSALLLAFIPGQAIAAPPATVHLTIHYQRAAGDYDTWNLWLWKNLITGTDGAISPAAGSEFTGNDAFGKVFTADITGMDAFDNIGIIVRKGNWLKKDIEVDRFITQFESSGNTEIWLVQGDPVIYPAQPTSKKEIRSAQVDDFRTITVSLSQKMVLAGTATEGFTLTPALPITAVKALNGGADGATQLALTLGADTTLGADYTLDQSDYGSAKVSAGKIVESSGFNEKFVYTGDDLGNTYSATETAFRVWAPTASAVSLLTYATATTASADAKVTPMTASTKGTWVAKLSGDQNGTIYDYRVTLGSTVNDAVDPYVRATTVNGLHGVVVNLAKTNPVKWVAKKPTFSGKSTDAVIYELHIRDLSIDSSSGVPANHQGKYLALTDVNTALSDKTKTGVAAIKDLGVTHVELQPVFDFASVNETSPSFNWGYDPQNYNVPEGSYSSNPSNPTARITELKTGIQSLHDQGLRVMMDVVYNHVYDAAAFSEEKIVPGYFFRKNEDGSLMSNSGCGNDVASERPMVRKFIVDSVKYWAKEYNVDGFRFDLMGLMDITTMNAIRAAVDKIDKTILIIGEGWNTSGLPEEVRGSQKNIGKLVGIAAFNDEIRDAIKGSVFNGTDTGYATGKAAAKASVETGIIGNVFYSRDYIGTWTTVDPTQSVNYVEAHDNLTLYDKLLGSVPDVSASTIAQLDRLAASIAILAQGVPFMQAGQEFLRSKDGDSNSYQSTDAVNSLKWNLRSTNAATVSYYKGLIALRKAHPVFRFSTTPQVQKNLTFLTTSNNVIAYSLKGSAVKDSWGTVVVAHNPNATAVTLTLPAKGDWKIVVQGSVAGVKAISTLKKANTVSIPPQSTLVLEK